jgi:hypothetical protein
MSSCHRDLETGIRPVISPLSAIEKGALDIRNAPDREQDAVKHHERPVRHSDGHHQLRQYSCL